MSNVNAEIKWQGNDNAWFSTNASTVYPANIQIFHTDGRYKFTDGVTTLGALSFLGGSQDLQSVLANDNKTGGSNIVISLGDLIKDILGVNYIDIQQAGTVEFGTTNGYFFIDASKFEIFHSVKLKLDAPLIEATQLTPSQIVETDASKNLVSAAKGTAYNKNFGTGTANIVEIGSTLSNSQIISTDANGKLQTLTTATYPSLTELAYIKGLTSSIQTQLDGKLSSTTYDLFITTGNQTTTSNVASNITDLVSPTLTANKRYKISGVLHVGCNNTGGLKIQITLPTGAIIDLAATGQIANSQTLSWGRITSSATLSGVYNSANNQSNILINGEISISSTSGTIQFGFASGANTQTSTIYQLGTQLTLTQIN